MPIAPGDAVVADANVLLSAALGKAALRVFTRFEVVVHSTRFNIEEVEEYLPSLAKRYGLPELLIQLQWRSTWPGRAGVSRGAISTTRILWPWRDAFACLSGPTIGIWRSMGSNPSPQPGF